MDDEIPPLVPPDQMPPVRNQADLHRFWRALMGPLGFGRWALWIALFGADGRLRPGVQEMVDRPRRPEERHVRDLLDLQHQALGVVAGPGGRVAFLLVRPGPARLTDDDREWASALLAGCEQAGLRCEPVHLATDERVVVLTPDDLAVRAAS